MARIIILLSFLSTICFGQIERWVYRYSGSNSYKTDVAYCLVYGSDGNLYAGGYTWNDSINQGLTVISLDNFGNERWIYQHPDSQEAHSICYGADGYIYVAGGSYTSSQKFTVISLTASGDERWVYRYPGTSNANEICYGNDGNIYAVGHTQGKISVVSLDSNGNERWTYIYSTPSSESDPGRSITYGPDGNIYVAGYTGPVWNTDVTVISLTPSGSERWVYLYNGPGGIYDYGECIIYGQDSNLYIFGSTCYLWGPGYVFSQGLVISLNSSGAERWAYISPADPSGFNRGVYDDDGNLYTAGAYGWDIPLLLVESVSDSGTFRWNYIDTSWSYARDIAENNRNIYAAGVAPDSAGDYAFTIYKFNDSGAIQWIYNYKRWSMGGGEASSVVYGLDGNIYAAGQTGDSITGGDFTVISLNPTGIEEDKDGIALKNKGLKLNVLPNIITRNALIHYALEKREHISLALYDILGREVISIAQGIFEPATYYYNFDSSDLNPGIYFLILEGEKERKAEKLLIVR